MKNLILFLFLIFEILEIKAQHTKKNTEVEIKNCIESTNDISIQIKCLSENYTTIDSLMNVYYKLLINSYKLKGTKSNLKKLKSSQKKWKKIRIKQCKSFYLMIPLENREIQKYLCLIELTTNRRNELSKFLNRFRR